MYYSPVFISLSTFTSLLCLFHLGTCKISQKWELRSQGLDTGMAGTGLQPWSLNQPGWPFTTGSCSTWNTQSFWSLEQEERFWRCGHSIFIVQPVRDMLRFTFVWLHWPDLAAVHPSTPPPKKGSRNVRVQIEYLMSTLSLSRVFFCHDFEKYF